VNRGKLAVVAMLLVAVGLAAYALWFNIQRGQRSLEFWGREGARRIQQARQVELLWLVPANDGAAEGERLTIGGTMYSVARRKDISQARGLIHARTALLDDHSYVWNEQDSEGGGEYELAARFVADGGATTVAFDFQRRLIAHVEAGREQVAAAKIARGWQSYSRQHAQDKVTLPPAAAPGRDRD
jgi:hypothetical protein